MAASWAWAFHAQSDMELEKSYPEELPVGKTYCIDFTIYGLPVLMDQYGYLRPYPAVAPRWFLKYRSNWDRALWDQLNEPIPSTIQAIVSICNGSCS